MGGYWAVKEKRHIIPVLLVIAVILVVGIAFSLKSPTQQDEGGDKNKLPSQESNVEDEGITFPYLLEDDKLEITSLFQSDIPNPDDGYKEVKNLASIELVNKSEEYLESADISIVLADGTALEFQIEDIPAGQKVWAFEKESIEIAADSVSKSIKCEANFMSDNSEWTKQFQTSSQNGTVTITNLTNEKQEGIKAIFHCLMEDTYFGGISYEYSVDVLSPEESTNVEVAECYLGEAETVYITAKK